MRKRWLLAAGAPFFSCYAGCGPAQLHTIAWDGKLPDGGAWDGGFIAYDDCVAICVDGGVSGYECIPRTETSIDCVVPGKGRAPPGLLGLSAVDRSTGSWIAQSAELEAASVFAFEQLALELEVHGLSALARAAVASASDELRHARVTTRLALRYGGCPSAPKIALPQEPRSLEAIALDNAAEGCGRELLGVEHNRWQATHSSDPDIRSVMAAIAVDEAAHARFSFALAETLAPRLTPALRRRAREAQQHALVTLASTDAPDAVRAAFGLMDPDESTRTARRLLDSSRL